MSKTRIIVHQPKNFESRCYRYYNIFFDNVILNLYNNFDVLESRYYKYANSKYYPALLLSQNQYFNDTTIQMLECEMILENYETKEIKVLSVSDDLTSTILNLQDSDYLSTVLVAQFDANKIYSHIPDTKNHIKYKPWIYFPQNFYDYNQYYELRSSTSSLIDKFYFRGTSLESRSIISHFNRQYFEGGLPIGGFDRYARDLIRYKMAFSIAGRGEFCYRDIECMAIGVPLIRFAYRSLMNPELIPDYHYISVDRPSDITHDSLLNETHSKMIEQKFLEVKDDKDFLQFISDNARNYYLNYIDGHSGVSHTVDLLELNKWI